MNQESATALAYAECQKRASALVDANDLVAARSEIQRLHHYGDPEGLGKRLETTLPPNYLDFQLHDKRSIKRRKVGNFLRYTFGGTLIGAISAAACGAIIGALIQYFGNVNGVINGLAILGVIGAIILAFSGFVSGDDAYDRIGGCSVGIFLGFILGAILGAVGGAIIETFGFSPYAGSGAFIIGIIGALIGTIIGFLNLQRHKG